MKKQKQREEILEKLNKYPEETRQLIIESWQLFDCMSSALKKEKGSVMACYIAVLELELAFEKVLGPDAQIIRGIFMKVRDEMVEKEGKRKKKS